MRKGKRKMTTEEILRKCDHTLLKQTASWAEIRALADDAIRFDTASICIPPCYVKQAKDYVRDKMKICTVIGFPNGNMTTAVKVFETEDAIKNGADEIDMVINIGRLKAREDALVLQEIRDIRNACHGRILKVIVETCLLNQEEKIRICDLVTESKADFIKTSTGFSEGGATFADVALFAEHVGENVKIKAAGGISTLQDAEEFIRLGAERLGTSRIVALAKAQ